MRIIFSTIALASLLLLGGCFGEEKTGPEKVHWDRDACEMCRMLISDPRFVTQVRGGPKMALHKFDDLGDALHWLIKQDWKNEPTTEIWVADMTSEKTVKWLDAKKAYYLDGQMTPMNYGYGAIAQPTGGSMPFVEVKDRVLGQGNNLICDVPGYGGKKSPEGHTAEDHARHMKDPKHVHDPSHNHNDGTMHKEGGAMHKKEGAK